MKSILACVTVLLLAAVLADRRIEATEAANPLPAGVAGPAVLDLWRNQITSLGSRREGYKILLSSRIAVQSTIQQEQDELESGDGVIAWANIAWNAISRPNEASTALSTPAVGFMQMAITQLAVYDVACALQGDYEPFSYDAPFEGQPDPNAAIATAAYRVLRTRIPGRADYLDAVRQLHGAHRRQSSQDRRHRVRRGGRGPLPGAERERSHLRQSRLGPAPDRTWRVGPHCA